MSAKLEFLTGKRKGEVVELASGAEFAVGNRKSAEVRIRDPWISYKHAKITCQGGQYFIEDEGSSNGTWIDGQRIERSALVPGSFVFFGKTKVKFMLEAAAAAAPTGDGPAWWDKVLEGGDGQPSEAAQAKLAALEAALGDERGMRLALERFLDVPEGGQLGDALQAGALEQQVQSLQARAAELESQLAQQGAAGGEAVEAAVQAAVQETSERLRRDHMTQVVELEAKAKQAESRAIDFENRLRDKTENAKAELKKQKESYEAELEQLRGSLEEARQGSAGDAAASERAAQLEQDLAAARTQARQLEEELSALRAELSEAQSARPAEGEDPEELKSQVWAAVEEATRWKELAQSAKEQLEAAQASAAEAQAKHDQVVQEIDEISMEQIEIEEELNLKIGLLKERLAAASGRDAAAVEAELAAALAEAKGSGD